MTKNSGKDAQGFSADAYRAAQKRQHAEEGLKLDYPKSDEYPARYPVKYPKH